MRPVYSPHKGGKCEAYLATDESDHRIPISLAVIVDEAGKLIASKPAICTGDASKGPVGVNITALEI